MARVRLPARVIRHVLRNADVASMKAGSVIFLFKSFDRDMAR